MVRIIKPDQQHTNESAPVLDQAQGALLNLLGIIIAEYPEKIERLLKSFGLEPGEDPDEHVLTNDLLIAIGENSREFNTELAELILDCSLDSNDDGFNIKGLLNKGDQESETDSNQPKGGGGGGMLSAISGAIQGIGGVVGKGLQNRQAKNQATSQTLQSVLAYKQQLAANRQAQIAPAKKSLNAPMIILISLFAMAGLGLLAWAMYNRRLQQPLLQASTV